MKYLIVFVRIILFKIILTSQTQQLHISSNISSLNLTLGQPLINNITINLQPSQYHLHLSSILQPIHVPLKYCHSHEGQLQIQKILTLSGKYFESKSSVNLDNQEEINQNDYKSEIIGQKMIYNHKYEILYHYNSQKNVINAFKISKNVKNDKQISHFGSTIPYFTQNQGCPVAEMILSKNQQYLYVFYCTKIVKIHCNRVITFVQTLRDFSSNTTTINDKKDGLIFSGFKLYLANEFIFWISKEKGIRTYGIEVEGNLSYIDTIKLPQQLRLKDKIADIEYNEGLLYVLTQKAGIHIYTRQGVFQFKYTAYLQYEDEIRKTNFKLEIFNQVLLISSKSKGWAFVTAIQMQKNKQNKNYFTYSLIRYYKGFRQIYDFQLYGSENILITSDKGLELYPIFEDPRQITILNNGIANNHFTEINQIISLVQNIYLFIEFESVTLVTINIEYPYFECQFPEQGSYNLKVRQKCALQKKCSIYENITFHVKQQSLSSISLLIVLISVTLTFIVILYLICWREGRLQVIETLVDQIQAFKLKKLKKIEFEQSSPSKPKKLRKWDELTEEFPAEDLSFRFDKSLQQNQMQDNGQTDQNLRQNFNSDRKMFETTEKFYSNKQVNSFLSKNLM